MTPFVIGIAGGTASGKSTLADALAARFGDRAASICHDRYYKTVPRHIASDPRRVFIYNYDHPDALDSALLAKNLRDLREGHPVKIPRYDYATSTAVPEDREVHPRPVILVDGILIFAEPALLDLFDLTVFVEAPDDVRLARRVRRDTTDRGQTIDHVLDQYLAMVKPMHDKFVAPSAAHADVVLNGLKPVDGLVSVVLRELRYRCPTCHGTGTASGGSSGCPRCEP